MSKYFSSSNKRSEISELKDDLNSTVFDRKKEAIKKVIAQMTIGKDVSQLFQPVIKCLEHTEIDIKKLVYLYIINYSRNRPDDAIMVINLFRKDVQKGTPLIRALAVRTMGCLRVKKLNEYLIDLLKEAVNDEDPYVRKTAALCVSKVYEVNPEQVEQTGLIEKMQNMLTKEPNPMVIANLVISLYEITQIGNNNALALNATILQKLLISINDCIEWGQIVVLDCLVNYIPADSNEAENIIDRILPRLSHINPAVVFSAIKLIIKFLDYINSPDAIRTLCKKLNPSLVTLVSWNQPEIQYIILKNINFILQKRPLILEKETKVFFCKFNEPYYIKIEKLEILLKLADVKNYEIVLNELSEYANEVDPDYVCRVVKVIGKIAIKVDKSVDKAISVLVKIIKTCKESGTTLTQEIFPVMQNIYRKYPGKVDADNSLHELMENLENAEETEPKSAAIWILGEYAEKIKNSVQIINKKIETFIQEERTTQLQMLTAGVKIFLKFPDEAENFITNLLQKATDETRNPDVRDRAYIYWRMLSSEPEKTKVVVLSDKPILRDETFSFESGFLDEMIENLALISSLVQKTPSELFKKEQAPAAAIKRKFSDDKDDDEDDEKKKNAAIVDDVAGVSSEQPVKKTPQIGAPQQSTAVNSKPNANDNIMDLLDMHDANVTAETKEPNNILELMEGNKVRATEQPRPQATSPNSNVFASNDLFGENNAGVLKPVQSSTPVPFEPVLKETDLGKNGKKGLKIEASFGRENNVITLNLKVSNFSEIVITELEVQMKPNFFNLTIEKLANSVTLFPNQSQLYNFNVNTQGQGDSTFPSIPLIFVMGIKTTLDIFYFNSPCMFHCLLVESGILEKENFRLLWKQIPETNELVYEIRDLDSIKSTYREENSLKEVLRKNNIFFLASRINDQKQTVMYFSAKSLKDIYLLAEINIPSLKNSNGCTLLCKSLSQNLIPLFLQCMTFILSN